ncbi:hypothetical protein EGT07_04780 [Herbaspirillum sp. HC18]|nr:hypothetical protein EGT07_04780 [Herbaspirillum sp. HC18]
MTPNLASARQAIQAELSHARQGIAYYSARVEALETALTQLEHVEGDEETSAGTGRRRTATGGRQKIGESKRGRKPRAAAQAVGYVAQKGKRGRKARAAASEKLPTTGGEFWLQLITDQPQTAVEIANAAIATVGLKPEQKEQIQKLKQRVAPALASLVAAQKVRDSGAGRERRFYKGGSAA